MSALMITLISIVGSLTYICMAGFTGMYFTDRARLGCSRASEGHYCFNGYCEHGFWWFAGIFWPLAVPFLYAAGKAEPMAERHHKEISWSDQRAERRRAKELREAEHRAKISAMREKEIELLEREAGIKR